MDDASMKKQFEDIVTGEAAGDMTKAMFSMYDQAIKAGFPEERAWQLTTIMIDKIVTIMGPELAKIFKG